MADLKMGTTVAGSTIWSQSNLPLLPSGNRLTFKGWKVYTETDKPTAEDIGALSLANGGTVAKNTTFGQSITVADNVTATEVYLSSGETIARSGNSAFINFKRTDLTNTPVQETTVQSINAYDGNSQLMSAYTVSKLTSGGNKIYLRGYKDGIQNTLLTIDTQSQQVSVEQGTFRVVGATTLSSLNATSATISGDVSAQKITPTDWSNIDQRYMTGYMKNFTGSSFGSVVDKNDVYTINGTLLSDGPKGNATYVGILVNYRSTRNTGVSLVQKYFDNDGATYIRKGVGSTSAYVWIGGDANGWSKIYDTSNKPTLVELNAAKSGINSDITSLTALSGSLRLGGDPVNDYDAATKRWVQNLISTGTTGPNMNGVMNYGVGDFHLRDSRAYIQPYEVLSDGQLLNRADWPELWAYAQMLSPISDAEWLADPEKRGRYSTGNGSTTFRVPDRNGAQPNSTLSLFGRGDGGNSSEDGRVYEAAAPNIYGTAANDTSGKVWQPAPKAVSGAFGYNSAVEDTFLPNDGTFSRVRNNAVLTINAGASDGVYGKYSIKNNILPRSFVGVWVIRASGGFVAANTSWSVNNADAVLPPVNTVVSGGRVSSKYKVGATDNFKVDFYAQAAIGSGITEARIEAQGSNTSAMRFTSNGHLYIPGTLLPQNGLETQSNLVARALFGNSDAYTATIVKLKSQESLDGVRHNKLSHLENSDCTVANYIYTVDGVAQYTWQLTRSDNINLWYSMRADSTMHTPLGQVAIQGSDVRIKDNFKLPKSGAWERIEQIGIVEFTYKGNSVPQRGWLAQQMGTIDPVYVFEGGQATDENGNAFDIINVNDKAVIADLVTVVQELQNKVIELEKQIANS